MSLTTWILWFSLESLLYYWIIRGNGSQYFGVVGVSEEGAKLYALFIWIVRGFWFVIGLFNPSLRLPFSVFSTVTT
ncbi:MAG: hypothetical protein Q4B71_05825 [Cardiobacteriaceae bacterium]|nr:hypothetical protein [Cardiobacteriaceae bacterium]